MNPICFSQIIGNDEIKNQLNRMVSKKAIGHALLFSGCEGIGKGLFAWALAARVFGEYDKDKNHSQKIQWGQHPDVHVYRPEGKLGLHTIQSLRKLSEEVYLPPYEASWKVFIIHDAERMLSYSANALLKTFEEPPSNTLMILLSHSHAALLPTIVSRCCTLHFRAIPNHLLQEFLKKRYSLDDVASAKITHQAQGSLGRAVRLVEGGDTLRIYLLNLLAQAPLGNYRLLQDAVQVLSEQVDKTKKRAEEVAKEGFAKNYSDQLTVQQQHAFEKELEGLMAIALAQEAQELLETILSWFRDLHFLLLGGNPSYLINPDFYPMLEQTVQRGNLKPLKQVCCAVEEAHLALQRSTPLSLCMENLFLKLDLV